MGGGAAAKGAKKTGGVFGNMFNKAKSGLGSLANKAKGGLAGLGKIGGAAAKKTGGVFGNMFNKAKSGLGGLEKKSEELELKPKEDFSDSLKEECQDLRESDPKSEENSMDSKIHSAICSIETKTDKPL